MSGRRHDLPAGIAGEVERELARLGTPAGPPLAALVSAWPGAVGAGIAANAWPARMTRDGTLVVHTSSSVWAQELTQLENELRERLQEAAPARIRFVMGPVPGAAAVGETRTQQVVDRPTAADRESARAIAGAIGDPELRALVAEAAAHSLAAARRRGATGASGMM